MHTNKKKRERKNLRNMKTIEFKIMREKTKKGEEIKE